MGQVLATLPLMEDCGVQPTPAIWGSILVACGKVSAGSLAVQHSLLVLGQCLTCYIANCFQALIAASPACKHVSVR